MLHAVSRPLACLEEVARVTVLVAPWMAKPLSSDGEVLGVISRTRWLSLRRTRGILACSLGVAGKGP